MSLLTAKQLSKRLGTEIDVENLYTEKQFVIHPLFLGIFKCTNNQLNSDSVKIEEYYNQLFSYEKYPHNNYAKLCIFIGVFPHLTSIQQLNHYLNKTEIRNDKIGFFDLFFADPESTTPNIKIDNYLETLITYSTSSNNIEKTNSNIFDYMLISVIDLKCRFYNNINILWLAVDCLSKNVSINGWNMFMNKVTTSLDSELRNGTKMTLYGRSNFILLLKLASVCGFSTFRYSEKIHHQLSSSLLRISFQCKCDSNEFQVMGYAFMNSLSSFYSKSDDSIYYKLLFESKKFLNRLPIQLRLKYLLMIKIISSLRKEIFKNHSPIEFLHLCYVVYFSNLFQSTDGLKTLRDILISYRYEYVRSLNNNQACVKSADRPYWLDVIVEIIISLLVHPSRWSKKICFVTFKTLAPNHIERSTWKMLYGCMSEPESVLSSESITNSNKTSPPISKPESYTDDIILDDATPEQLAELEKLSHLIRHGNPIKQAKSSSTTTLYRAFQQRILGMLELAPKLGLSKIQTIEYSADIVRYLVNFKPNLTNKKEEQNFISKLLLIAKIFVHMKNVSLDNMTPSLDRKINKMVNFASKHFIEYSYKMKKTPEFLNIWFKWLFLVQSILTINTKFEAVQLEIMDDFLSKRNPLMKKDYICMLITNPNLCSKTLNAIINKICDCLCDESVKLRGPQLVNVTYVLTVALKVLAKNQKVSSSVGSMLIEKCEKVMKHSKSFPKNEKIKSNISTCNKQIKKIYNK